MRRLRDAGSDEGLSLIELMLYGLLLTLVIGVLGGFMISAIFTERSVRSVTAASTSGQLVADTITTGIRNSTGFAVTIPSSGDQMLTARVWRGPGASDAVCQAWYFSGSGKIVRFRESATAIAAPSTSTLATWTRLADGVVPSSGTTIFSVASQQLTLSFEVLAGSNAPAGITSLAGRRSETWVSAPCF